MRSILIAHVPGPQPVTGNIDRLRPLLLRHWIRLDRPHRPRTSSLTPTGHTLAIKAMAYEAELLEEGEHV